MSKRDVRLLLEDIRDAAEKIITYTVRNFEIIGEAAKRIPDDEKLTHPEIPWRHMTGFRNRMIHDYFGVDYEILWQIKEQNIPELIEQVKAMLK